MADESVRRRGRKGPTIEFSEKIVRAGELGDSPVQVSSGNEYIGVPKLLGVQRDGASATEVAPRAAAESRSA